MENGEFGVQNEILKYLLVIVHFFQVASRFGHAEGRMRGSQIRMVAEKVVNQQVGMLVTGKWIGGKRVARRTQADNKLAPRVPGCQSHLEAQRKIGNPRKALPGTRTRSTQENQISINLSTKIHRGLSHNTVGIQMFQQ